MTELITTNPSITIEEYYEDLDRTGAAADEKARSNVFEMWRNETAYETRRRKMAGVNKFAEYICSLSEKADQKDEGRRLALSLRLQCERLKRFAADLRDEEFTNPLDGEVWNTLTFGVIEGFKAWLLNEGYAINTVNLRISTLRKFADLAFKAGYLSVEDNMLIQAIQGIARKVGMRIDENREKKNIKTRVGHKKEKSVDFSHDEVMGLIDKLPKTPQGYRDRVVLTLAKEHGLRVSELSDLETDNFNLDEGKFTFRRRKTGSEQTHEFKANSGKAIRDYFRLGYAIPGEKLIQKSHRYGKLMGPGITVSSLYTLINTLGKEMGFDNLSPHDFRHHYATDMSKNETEFNAGVAGGGWANPSMYLRYVNKGKVANAGVKLSSDVKVE